MWCAVGVHQVVRRGVWGYREWCVAACWGNRGVRHNIRYRTVTARLASGGCIGGSFSGHREIKRVGSVPKVPFLTLPPFRGGYIDVSGFKDHFS